MEKMDKERQAYEAALQEQKKVSAQAALVAEANKRQPQIRNLNADPQMDGKFVYPFKNGANKAGKQNADFKPDLSLGGVGIASPHCVFNYNPDVRKANLGPNEEDPERYPTRVNGDLLKESVELKHGDRILIGSHAYYIYIDPDVNPTETYEYELAVKEANKDSIQLVSKEDEEKAQAALAELEARIKAEKETKEKELAVMKA